jgi:hypothetical protein
MASLRYELSFFGAAHVRGYRFPRFRSQHIDFDSAAETAARVYARLEQLGVKAAHPAVVFGPDCGPYGRPLL